ncbi:CehA/McbA family metallohydrolase [Candidatus Methylacidithermus pantelleriae]|uniref:CehA/McbA family metallohydrolase n=1 Tax=Candidatus Methylacidithermus pantelleriae TaxID=2744239 RepID=UPI00157C62F4|nr:PHP domain-containing protein [Candidatus Methylacidithermus pantelleriae]
MILKIDFHCHSRFSADGISDPEEMVAKAKRRGLDGFALTDHDTCDGILYCYKAGLARPDGKPVDGFLILPGQEITTRQGHLLALGVLLPNLHGIDAKEAVTVVHSSGGLAIPPHPFDYFRAGIRSAVLDTLDIDGVEVFNSATTFRHCNRRAWEYARQRGLPMIACSDAHYADVIGTAYTMVETKEFTVEEILGAVRKGTSLKEHYISPKEALKKTWNNVLRLRRRTASQTLG